MGNKKYSIIIPHYNSIEKLKILIDSIGYRKDIEIIIVDDKSDDKIKNTLEKYVKKSKYTNFVKLYFNEGIKSAGSCRNIGIDKACGEWLIFADSDDYFLKNYLNILDDSISNNYEIIYFIPKSSYENTDIPAERHLLFEKIIKKYLHDENLINLDNLKYKFVVPWSKVLKSSFIKNNKIYFDEIIASNDVMFSLKSAHKAENVKVVSEKIYMVTVTKGSLTQRFNKEIFRARLKNALESNTFFKKNNIRGQERVVILYLVKSYSFGVEEFIRTYKFIKKYNFSIFIGVNLKNIINFLLNYFRNNKLKNKGYFVNEMGRTEC